MDLTGFLQQNVLPSENIKFAPSKRFTDPKTGKPLCWEITTITNEESDNLRKNRTKRVPLKGMKGQFTEEFDSAAYIKDIITRCVVFPNLNSAELQDSWGVMGAHALLGKMLLPGEFNELLEKVQEHNGFNIGIDELVEEAKN